MLTNIVNTSTATWPRSRSGSGSNSLMSRQKTTTHDHDKIPRYPSDHTTITLNFKSPTKAPVTLVAPNSTAEEENALNCPASVRITSIKIGNKRKVSFSKRIEKQSEIAEIIEIGEKAHAVNSKISQDCLGVSVDSTVSSVFESFETVSEISTLSQGSDGERIEKCFSDLLSATKVCQDVAADNLTVYNDAANQNGTTNNQNNRLCYAGFAHGSFQDVSLAELNCGWYGIRDLKSETSLNNLKEHILCAERNREPSSKQPIVDGCGITGNLGSPFRDKLISLSSGYIFSQNLPEKPTKVAARKKSKIFASLQEIDKDSMTSCYFDSLRYLKQKDVESCRASGPGLKHGTVGQRATFYIFSDKDNSKLLKVYISGPRMMPPKNELNCLAEGFYSVTYWPDRVGWYTVNILWRAKHIAGSPYQVLMLLPKRQVWVKRC